MKKYKQLSLEEREVFYALLMQKQSLRYIAKQLNRSHTTLSRELERNREYARPYIPCQAHYYAYQRMHQQRSIAPLKCPEIYEYVRQHLEQKWSPETIAGRLPIDHPGFTIHHESIYRYIYWDRGEGLHLWKYLTHARQKRMKKFGRKVRHSKTIPDGLSIDLRPKEARYRRVIGHWETDNVIGKKTEKTAISTTVERVTRYAILTKLADRSAQEKYNALVNRLMLFPEKVRRSMTADNGHENSKHKEITKALNMPMYFCHPYTSCEKGSVENMNGRIRRCIPKKKSMMTLTDTDVAAVEHWLNNTPRKCLGYKTPEEAMQEAIWANSAYGFLPKKVLADRPYQMEIR